MRLNNGCSEAGRWVYGGGEEVRVLSSFNPVPIVPILYILRRQDHRQIRVHVNHALNKYTLAANEHLNSVTRHHSLCSRRLCSHK